MTHENLASALAAAQSEMKNPVKDQTASVQTRSGGSYKYGYVGLPTVIDAVRESLTKHGIAFIQLAGFALDSSGATGQASVTTILKHVSGEEMSGTIFMPCDATPQAIGSAITYARRYGLQSICGIAAEEDDDAQKAQEGPAKRVAEQKFIGKEMRKDFKPEVVPEKQKSDLLNKELPSWLVEMPEEKKLETTLKISRAREAFRAEVAKRVFTGVLPKTLNPTHPDYKQAAEELLKRLVPDCAVKEFGPSDWEGATKILKQEYPFPEPEV